MKIEIRVVPNASKEQVKDTTQGLKVYVTCAPEKGKANKRVIAVLAKHLGVKKSSLEIVKGHTSRNKTIQTS